MAHWAVRGEHCGREEVILLRGRRGRVRPRSWTVPVLKVGGQCLATIGTSISAESSRRPRYGSAPLNRASWGGGAGFPPAPGRGLPALPYTVCSGPGRDADRKPGLTARHRRRCWQVTCSMQVIRAAAANRRSLGPDNQLIFYPHANIDIGANNNSPSRGATPPRRRPCRATCPSAPAMPSRRLLRFPRRSTGSLTQQLHDRPQRDAATVGHASPPKDLHVLPKPARKCSTRRVLAGRRR